jgi:pimeloyl-ACP methyl ester carboxylesterase
MPLRAFGPLFGQVHGAGLPDVIALHGWARRGTDFDRVLRGRNAVAFDLPGFGATPAPDHAMGSQAYADILLEALDEIGPGPFRIVGHSFGGRVAVHLAASHPGRVVGMVLTGAPLLRLRPVTRPPLGYRLIRLGHRIGVVGDDRMEAVRRSRGSPDYRAATGVMREVFVRVVNESYEDQLAAIVCPVELVWGENDSEVPVTVAERARDLFESAGSPVRLTVVGGVGHLVPTEAPDALVAAIERIES